VFDYADFVYKIQQPGVILLDEINRADQTAMNILLPVLDDTRVLRLDIGDAEERREIPVHPDCIFVATANIGSEYAGTNEMDAALKNRFLVVEIDDMPAEEEAKVLSIKCGISKEDASIIVKISNSIRDLYEKGQVSYKISTRETQAVGDLVHDGLTISESLKWIFCPKFSGTLTSGEKNLVNQAIDTYFSGR
jgi:nitric oxide reductase NorQ protein